MTPLWTAPLWTAQHLAIATGGAMAVPFDATGVSIDTRTLRPGDLFVALAGESRDGHDFVADALARGAAGALVHHDIAGLPAGAKLLRVDDTLAALHRLGEFARARFTGRMAAITGSVGKTTTKEMLRRILSTAGPTHAAEASYNNQWGLPLTLARLPPEAAFCVAEIGTNHPGEIAPLARLARPHVALITAIEKAHVGHFGSIEAIADEKAALLEGLEPGGTAILPRDTPLLARLVARARGAKTLTFGTALLAEARLLEAESDADSVSVMARLSGDVVSLRLAAPGAHMAMNALAALAAAVALGLPPAASAAALDGFAPLAGRGARRRIAWPDGEVLLLDESYNASAVAVRAALAVLKLQPADRRVVVLGDMLELGEDGPAEHEGLADAVAETADLLFTCGPLMRLVFDAAPAAIRGAHAENSAALAPVVADALRAGDAVLIKGSLGMRMRAVVDALIQGRG